MSQRPLLRIGVIVQPGSRQERIAGRLGDAVKVQVRARPVEGAANRAVIDVLAEALGVARRDVTIARGAAARTKLVTIECDEPEACRNRLEERIAAAASVDIGRGRA